MRGSKGAAWSDRKIVTTLIRLEQREPDNNQLRFYNIAVTPTLFGS